MPVDIRASVTCSLGTLISATISDDYIQGTGLIKCKGSCEISGLITPSPGTVVTFSYTKGGVTRRIPRQLLVLSSFADPFRRTTKVEVGCRLTFLQDLKDPLEWSALDDPENADITEEEAEIITFPIYASSVAAECLSKLGISGTAGLTNKFSIAKFDFSPGYVQVLSDLLVSECKCGYINESGSLSLINLNITGGSGVVLSQDRIIDVGAIGVGELPADQVTVSYSSLKLKVTEEELEIDEDGNLVDPDGNWVGAGGWPSATSSATSGIAISYTDSGGNQQVRTYNVLTKTKETTQFRTINGRTVTSRREVEETTSKVAVAGGIASEYLSAGQDFGSGSATATTVETFEYDSRGNEVRRILRKTGDAIFAAGSLGVPFVVNDELVAVPGGTVLLQEEITNTYRSSSYTKTVTDRYGTWIQSIQGQQAVAAGFDSFTSAAEVSDYISQALAGRYLIDTQISIVKGDTTEEGPSQEEINNANVADEEGDPNIDYRAEATAGLELVTGINSVGRRIELSMPYAPDDRFIKGAQIPDTDPPRYHYYSVASDAPVKARAFGRAQNTLLYGNRNGMNVQTAPEYLPGAPFSAVTVQASGLSAMYRTNGTSWTMDASGIVVSSDLLYMGAVGGTGDFWFPVAPGITTLPTTPPVVDTTPIQIIGSEASLGEDPVAYLLANYPEAIAGDGVFNEETQDFWTYDGVTWNNVGPTPGPTIEVDRVVPPWNETVLLTSRVRAKVEVQSLAYALNVETVVDPYGVTVGMTAARVLPVATLGLAAAVPTVSTGASVAAPAMATALAGAAPAVAGGASVTAPAADVALAAISDIVAGRPRTQIAVPVGTIAAAVGTPTVSIGAAVSAPANGIILFGAAPRLLDPATRTYVQAVEAADGQPLERGVVLAIDNFVLGCKSDGIWSAIKASCIMAGARTLAGALTPLVGTAPTNNNFVAGDYSRTTGLAGDGSTKYLNSNRAGNADPQNNAHLAVQVTAIASGDPGAAPYYISSGAAGSGAKSLFRAYVLPNLLQHGVLPTANTVTTAGSSTPANGFLGYSRTGASAFIFRNEGVNTSGTTASQTPTSDDTFVLARNNGSNVAERYSNARLSFYSIGESLDLALLDSRVSTLMADIAAALA